MAQQLVPRSLLLLLGLAATLISAAPAPASSGAKVASKPASVNATTENFYLRRHGHPYTAPSTTPAPLCTGSACQRMSDLLPQLKFKVDGTKVQCSCADFTAGKCFAPGCFVCDKACFVGLPPAIANSPGPLGTGLLCSSGCTPCCLPAPSTSSCELPASGCT